MSHPRSILKRRGVFAALFAALAVVLAPSALSASASPSAASPPVICLRVPSSGLLPPGQTASTPLEPSNEWQWSASSARQPFRWAVINRNGVIVASGYSPGPGGSVFVPFNYNRWQVTNLGNVGQYWRACYSSGP
ncbi:MAG TPA: hypothetical protein VE596_09100 [Gaiellaceae bacterium]|jgi:hypothetical protein|nr:hypothetical protein [Gaiellaceae bacterium]